MNYKTEGINLRRIGFSTGPGNQEALIFTPNNGAAQYPGVIFLHGHRSSAWESSLFGYFLSREGYAVLIPSQVGYGMSEGKPDFCGPATVNAVLKAIEIFKEMKFVDSQKLAVWGVSRGATVAGLLAGQNPQLFNAAVMQSGIYDIQSYYNHIGLIPGMREVIDMETEGINAEKTAERSPAMLAERIQCPTLILHGELDDRVPIDQAIAMSDRLSGLNKTNELVVVPGGGHAITKQTRKAKIFPFLRVNLK